MQTCKDYLLSTTCNNESPSFLKDKILANAQVRRTQLIYQMIHLDLQGSCHLIFFQVTAILLTSGINLGKLDHTMH